MPAECAFFQPVLDLTGESWQIQSAEPSFLREPAQRSRLAKQGRHLFLGQGPLEQSELIEQAQELEPQEDARLVEVPTHGEVAVLHFGGQLAVDVQPGLAILATGVEVLP